MVRGKKKLRKTDLSILAISFLGILLFTVLLASGDQFVVIVEDWMGIRKNSFNQKVIGKLETVSNDVRLKAPQSLSWSGAPVFTKVFESQRVYVGDNSEATIRLNDGSVITLKANSMVTLRQVGNQVALNLEYGNFAANLAADSQLILQDPEQSILLNAESARLTAMKKNGRTVFKVDEGEIDAQVFNEQRLSAKKKGTQSLFSKVFDLAKTSFGAKSEKNEIEALLGEGAMPAVKIAQNQIADLDSLSTESERKKDLQNASERAKQGQPAKVDDILVSSFPAKRSLIADLSNAASVPFKIDNYDPSDRYRIDLYNEQSQKWESFNVTGPNQTLSLGVGNYKYKVVSLNKNISDSLVLPFEIEALNPIQILQPSNGSLFVSSKINPEDPALPINFKWISDTKLNTSNFEVLISKDPKFQGDVKVLKTTESQLITSTLPDGQYYWKVKPISGNNKNALESEVNNFTVSTKYPAMEAPDFTSVQCGREVEFNPEFKKWKITWSKEASVKNYLIDSYKDNVKLSSLVNDVAAADIPISVPGDYEVRIRARNGAGETSKEVRCQLVVLPSKDYTAKPPVQIAKKLTPKQPEIDPSIKEKLNQERLEKIRLAEQKLIDAQRRAQKKAIDDEMARIANEKKKIALELAARQKAEAENQRLQKLEAKRIADKIAEDERIAKKAVEEERKAQKRAEEQELARVAAEKKRLADELVARLKAEAEAEKQLKAEEEARAKALIAEKNAEEARIKAAIARVNAEAARKKALLDKQNEQKRLAELAEKQKAEEARILELETKMKARLAKLAEEAAQEKARKARLAELELLRKQEIERQKALQAEAERIEEEKRLLAEKARLKKLQDEFKKAEAIRLAQLELQKIKEEQEQARLKAELLKKQEEERLARLQAELLKKQEEERKAALLKKQEEEEKARLQAELLKKQAEENARLKAELLKKQDEDKKLARIKQLEEERARLLAELKKKEELKKKTTKVTKTEKKEKPKPIAKKPPKKKKPKKLDPMIEDQSGYVAASMGTSGLSATSITDFSVSDLNPKGGARVSVEGQFKMQQWIFNLAYGRTSTNNVEQFSDPTQGQYYWTQLDLTAKKIFKSNYNFGPLSKISFKAGGGISQVEHTIAVLDSREPVDPPPDDTGGTYKSVAKGMDLLGTAEVTAQFSSLYLRNRFYIGSPLSWNSSVREFQLKAGSYLGNDFEVFGYLGNKIYLGVTIYNKSLSQTFSTFTTDVGTLDTTHNATDNGVGIKALYTF